MSDLGASLSSGVSMGADRILKGNNTICSLGGLN